MEPHKLMGLESINKNFDQTSNFQTPIKPQMP